MKQLVDILNFIGSHEAFGNVHQSVEGLCIDSRQAKSNFIYIAIIGYSQDGHTYIEAAITNGARVVVCENLPNEIHSNICYIKVKSTKDLAGIMANVWYNFPSKSLKLVGVTGTNGKTSCTTILYKLFSELGYACGLISTVKNMINNKTTVSTHTTPDPISLCKLLAEMRDAQCEYVFMEVSSHAIHQQRIIGLEFTGAVFTNITHDHLDYHKTFDEYISVKKKFFDDLNSDAFALVNKDDKRGAVMLQNTKAHRNTFSVNGVGDFNAKVVENSLQGLHMKIENIDVYSTLVGLFNAYNFITVYAVSQLLKQDKSEVLPILSKLTSADGRFDILVSPKKKILGIIDYAHTPDALKNVLQTINEVKTGDVNLITVLGCGGDRDKFKRPLMAELAAQLSHQSIFTSDNPRSENPNDILNEMELGVPVHLIKNVLRQVDRKEAIKMACTLAKSGDVILLAGKGHETYQEIEGVKYPFDDKMILNDFFNQLEL